MIKLLTTEDMRDSDAYTIANVTPSRELMYRAGKAVFQYITPDKSPVAIICGSGNNAGDGYVIALLCHEAGIPVTIIRCSNKLSEDGSYYYGQCEELKIPSIIADTSLSLTGFNTIVDCLLGTGFHGVPEGLYADAIGAINSSGAYVISVDINSGLNGNSGLGDLCVHSDITVSIGFYQPGHYLGQAKDVMVTKVNADIGIMPTDDSANITLLESSDCTPVLRPRRHNSHKGTYGYIGLIGGSTNYSGAIRLANIAASAMRSGAGVVKLASPGSLSDIICPHLLESTFYPLSDDNGSIIFDREELEGFMHGTSAIAVGMGIGTSGQIEKLLTYLLTEYTGTLVIDADAINVLSRMDQTLLKESGCSVILTPHPKEFSRLTDLSVGEILSNPIKHAMEYANNTKTIVLLKGTATIITDGSINYITDTGCPGMATAGSGDVLSGVITALCGYNKDSALLAAAAASYITGVAGELAGAYYGDISMVASDTALFLPKAILQTCSPCPR